MSDVNPVYGFKQKFTYVSPDINTTIEEIGKEIKMLFAERGISNLNFQVEQDNIFKYLFFFIPLDQHTRIQFSVFAETSYSTK